MVWDTLLSIGICGLVLGGIIVGGWFLYPYLSGHEYVGTVENVRSISILGVSVHVVILEGRPETYIVAPGGIKKGDYVMVDGYVKNIPLTRKNVVIGVDNIENLSVAANVVSYSRTPFSLGLGILGIGGALLIISIAGAIITHLGTWAMEGRKYPSGISARLALIFSMFLWMMGIISSLAPLVFLGFTSMGVLILVLTYKQEDKHPGVFKGGLLMAVSISIILLLFLLQPSGNMFLLLEALMFILMIASLIILSRSYR